MARHRGVEAISEVELTRALWRTPLDHHVIWAGRAAGAQAGSLRSRALELICEPWAPISLRALILRAAAIEDGAGFKPEAVRNAVRMHQSARPAVYFLVSRDPGGDYLAVADVPWPLGGPQRLRAGDCVMTRDGRTFLSSALMAS